MRSRRSPSCANTSATSSSVAGDAAADAERLVERLGDQSRYLGVVRKVEPGVDVGFERELAQQRQTEGVDRRDRDVAEPFLQLAPAGRVELRQPRRLPKPFDDAFAHLGGGLAREGDREDVIGVDAGAQQVDVALDEHTRLARPGGRLEHDVAGRIDGVFTGRGVRCLRHSPSCTRRRNCTARTGRRRRAWAGTRRARWRRAYPPAAAALCASVSARPFVGCEEGNDPLRSLEGQIHGFAERPLAIQRVELLFGADAVNRQLQRLAAVGRPAQLVVDQAEGAVAQQVEPIGLAPQRESVRGPDAVCSVNVTVQRVLEQACHHRHRAARLPCGTRLHQVRPPPANREGACARAPPRLPARAASARSTTDANSSCASRQRRRRDRRVPGVAATP